MSNSRATVVVTETLDPVPARWLGERVKVVWCPHEKKAELARELAAAEGMVVRTYTLVNEALLAQAPRLKVVGRAGVGLDNIDIAACARRGVKVVYTPDANTQAVVEYVIGLMLDDLRPRYTMAGAVTAEEFHKLRKEQVGRQLDELTLGVVGFGRIGKRLGKVAAAIGMRVMVNDLLPEKGLRAAVDYPFEYVDKATLFRGSDVVTIHVDGRKENRGMVDAEALGWMKKDALLINAARGMLVDNEALAAWARGAGRPGGRAILDVHEPEPPAEGYVLHGLRNVRLLPHLASRTGRALENMSWVVRDVVRVIEGEAAEFEAGEA